MTNPADAVDTALWIGKEMMECGANSSTVEESMLSFLHLQGYGDAGVLVLPKSVLISVNAQSGFYTKMKHIDDVSPNFDKLARLHAYSKKPLSNSTDFKNDIENSKPLYSKMAFIGVPIGCASFGLMLGCDIYGAIAVLFATFAAFWLKGKIAPLGVSHMFVNLICAFAATFLAFLFSSFFDANGVEFAQAASTFFLIPGVQLINAFEDMLRGHYLNGSARALRAIFLSFGIVFGIILALVVERTLAWSF
jgi:uncharacterized membrane protein YjjP (DUF1212 family)